MKSPQHLYFRFDVGMEKFKQNADGGCPFCNREGLTGILAEQGPLLLLRNKFATLAGTTQTVLIETDDCASHIGTYSREQFRNIVTFGTDQWLAMENSGKYASVVFYKNHGPLSGGTVGHAHMQIVGLESIDYRENMTDEMFGGIEIHREGDAVLNLSLKPSVSATEYNIITPGRNDAFMADNIQIVVKHLLKRCGSYNLFFYQWNNAIVCKIVPRYPTSPYFVGYGIPQTLSNLEEIAAGIREAYYT